MSKAKQFHRMNHIHSELWKKKDQWLLQNKTLNQSQWPRNSSSFKQVVEQENDEMQCLEFGESEKFQANPNVPGGGVPQDPGAAILTKNPSVRRSMPMYLRRVRK